MTVTYCLQATGQDGHFLKRIISLECILEQNDERNYENLNCFENDQSVLWKLLYIIIYFVYNKINMTISRTDFNSVRIDPLFFTSKLI